MNRRGFFSSLARGLAAISILPAATTYARSKWVAQPGEIIQQRAEWIINPAWRTAIYEMRFMVKDGNWVQVNPVIFKRGMEHLLPEDAIYHVADRFPLRFESPDITTGPIPAFVEYDEKTFAKII